MVTALGLGILLVRGHEMGITKADFTALAAALFMCYDPPQAPGRDADQPEKRACLPERINYLLKEPGTPCRKPPILFPWGELPGVYYDGVSFSYDGARKVLDGIDVHISPGEVVGLVGPSGAGKTTFASLLPRFLRRQFRHPAHGRRGCERRLPCTMCAEHCLRFPASRALPRHHHGKHPAGAAGRHG